MSYSDNPLTQLPTVDFNFEDLRKRMTDFTLKFDAFIEQGRKRVLQERNEFRARLGELNGALASTRPPSDTANSHTRGAKIQKHSDHHFTILIVEPQQRARERTSREK
jgi:hypothetical protein